MRQMNWQVRRSVDAIDGRKELQYDLDLPELFSRAA